MRYNVEVAGYYYINSDYFESRGNPLWDSAPTSLTLATSGNLSLAYMLKHLRIESGADFSLYTSTLMFDDKAKKNLSYPSLSDGSAVPVTAGEKTQVRVERTEFFWELFLQASVYF